MKAILGLLSVLVIGGSVLASPGDNPLRRDSPAPINAPKWHGSNNTFCPSGFLQQGAYSADGEFSVICTRPGGSTANRQDVGYAAPALPSNSSAPSPCPPNTMETARYDINGNLIGYLCDGWNQSERGGSHGH